MSIHWLSQCFFTFTPIITLELNELDPKEPSDVSTSHLTNLPVPDVKSSDKTEKEEDILRLDDDDSEAKSRKQDETSSKQGLKDMRSSDLFGMLVSRRIRKQENWKSFEISYL